MRMKLFIVLSASALALTNALHTCESTWFFCYKNQNSYGALGRTCSQITKTLLLPCLSRPTLSQQGRCPFQLPSPLNHSPPRLPRPPAQVGPPVSRHNLGSPCGNQQLHPKHLPPSDCLIITSFSEPQR